MYTTTQLKEFAQLAQAAYALLNDKPVIYSESDDAVKLTKLQLQGSPNGGFAEGEATDFTNRYRVLNQFRDSSPSCGYFTRASGFFVANTFASNDGAYTCAA